MSLSKRCAAEAFGTFWLVFGGCGSAVLAAGFALPGAPPLGIGFAGVALAFGLTLMTMVYAIGPISGCHINPAVTVGLWAAKRFPAKEILPYWIAQVAGGLIAGGVLFAVASGAAGFDVHKGFASNGYGLHSPGGYGVMAAIVAEFVLTFMFLFIILASTEKRAPAGFAGIAIGFALTLIHLISIPVDNTSVNPARSTGVALFAGGDFIAQLWLFWIVPLIGAAVAGFAYSALFAEQPDERLERERLSRNA
ncbi:MAG: aquaporin Z [Candidatus Eremiobacteraeota bacterium]|nr:aquaporin Z [Candidatus Eremiobacteraeota bacterium]